MNENGFYIKDEQTVDSWMSIHLKPCPFCGRRVSFIEVGFEGGSNNKLELRCNNCSTDFIIAPDGYLLNDRLAMEKTPANIWNSRYEEKEEQK